MRSIKGMVVEWLGKPLNNLVLVKIEDTFSEFTTKGGIELINHTGDDVWADSKDFTLSEHVPRHGTVISICNKINRESYTYETELEVKKGDEVYWGLSSFRDHFPIIYENENYLLLDYHTIIARMRGKDLLPVNTNILLSPIHEEFKALAYTKINKISKWWKVIAVPEIPKNIRWDVGDKIFTIVGTAAMQLEGNLIKSIDKNIYAVPERFVIYGK